MICTGTGDDHCCWLGGYGVCRFLVEHVAGRRWSCSLRTELGDWARVHVDARYVAVVQPFWDGYGDGGGACGDWPPPGVRCGTCGGVD